MGVTTLTAPPGISPSKVVNIPAEWSAAWFQDFIKRYLQPADIRNAIEGTGITITGSGNEYATISATGGGTGTVTSVGLSDTSTTPIFAVSNSPVTTHGTLDITLETQSANKIFGGPTTGSAAQPTFRSLVAADIPTLNQNTTGTAGGLTGGVADSIILSGGNLQLSGDSASPGDSMLYGTNASGTKGWYAQPSGASSANPSATIGLSAVDGSATTFMTSDSAPALSQAIAPTWTGAHTFTPGASTVGITVNAASGKNGAIFNGGSGAQALKVVGSSSSGNSYGLVVLAGTGTGDVAMSVYNQAGSTGFFYVFGDGGVQVGSATGGDEGFGTINVSGGYYVNGVAIGSGSGTGANVQTFQPSGGASQTYTLPTGAKMVQVIVVGGGGGGGSGPKTGITGSTGGGGGGAGASGGLSVGWYLASTLGASVTITFSSTTGGAGGAAQTTSGSNGNPGTAGANASFGSYLTSAGGGNGAGGVAGGAGSGGAGSSTGLTCQGTAGGTGGTASGGAGGAGTSNAGSDFTATAFGPTGGGGGGGLSTTPAAANGGAGGGFTTFGTISGGGFGSAGGGAGGIGGNGTQHLYGIGTGGGGGGSATGTTSGGNGGNGGGFGAGGGGGGACQTGAAQSGKGGNGGPAAVICIAW